MAQAVKTMSESTEAAVKASGAFGDHSVDERELGSLGHV